MDRASTIVALAVGIIAIVGAVARWRSTWLPRQQRREADRIAQRDALIGRPPIYDSITRKEISPALPGIGQRMASMEEIVSDLVKSTLRHAAHEKQLLLHADHLAEHDGRIKALENAQVERVVNRAESAAAWRAMEAATKSKSVDEILGDDPDRP